MNPKVRKALSIILFVINAFLWSNTEMVDNFIDLIGATTIPLLIYTLPGYLYYKYSCKILVDKNDINYHKKPALIFAIFGIV
jgi:amino acid permease